MSKNSCVERVAIEVNKNPKKRGEKGKTKRGSVAISFLGREAFVEHSREMCRKAKGRGKKKFGGGKMWMHAPL